MPLTLHTSIILYIYDSEVINIIVYIYIQFTHIYICTIDRSTPMGASHGRVYIYICVCVVEIQQQYATYVDSVDCHRYRSYVYIYRERENEY